MSLNYPQSIDEALNMSLEELAPFGDFGGVVISQVTEYDDDEDFWLRTQLVNDTSKYHIYNVSSLGNLARIIVDIIAD